MEIDYEQLMEDCQQICAYYEVIVEEGYEGPEFLKESLDFLADRYDSLIALEKQYKLAVADA